MGWLDNQSAVEQNNEKADVKSIKELDIKIPGQKEWIRVNKNQVYDIYNDEFPILLVVMDEIAELTLPTGIKTEEGKEEDAMKQEIQMLMQSISQLGRAAGIHIMLATQRSGTAIINGTTQANLRFRLVCGRLNQMSSMMATESTIATTISSNKGAGAVYIDGKIDMMQAYFAKPEWIKNWYAKRGLNPYGKLDNEMSNGIDADQLENLEGEEDIAPIHDSFDFEFDGVKGEVDKTAQQNYEEV